MEPKNRVNLLLKTKESLALCTKRQVGKEHFLIQKILFERPGSQRLTFPQNHYFCLPILSIPILLNP